MNCGPGKVYFGNEILTDKMTNFNGDILIFHLFNCSPGQFVNGSTAATHFQGYVPREGWLFSEHKNESGGQIF
jgi:hypothetical protein